MPKDGSPDYATYCKETTCIGLFELDGVIAGLGHGFQHVALAGDFTIVKLAERIPQGVALRTGSVGINPGDEIQGVLRINQVVDPGGEAGADNEVLEFLRYSGQV